jgi:hypothetical protein
MAQADLNQDQLIHWNNKTKCRTRASSKTFLLALLICGITACKGHFSDSAPFLAMI